jgi:hypothetical protein
MNQKFNRNQLDKLHICTPQYRLFLKTFGDEADVTLENCIKAIRVGLRLGWLAAKIFTIAATDQYQNAEIAAWKQHVAAKEDADKQYETAWEQCRAARETAWKQYLTTTGTAFFEIYTAQLALNERKDS